MTNIGIYRMISPSNKVYIGQSWNLKEREGRYKCASKGNKGQVKLYNSISKYGFQSHNFMVIHELPIDVTQEILDNYEILYWQLYKDCNLEMLNIKEPGSKGKPSEESKQKMRDAKVGVKHSKDRNEAKSIYQTGRVQNSESINKRVEKNTGKKRSEEFKEKCRQKYLGIAPVNALKASIESRMRKVEQLTREGISVKIWDSATIAESILDIDASTIGKVCRNTKHKTAGGFKWRYI